MTTWIKIEDILISPERQRQEFDPEAIIELGNSISTHGILHPPVVRESEGRLVLVAGERRLRAMQNLLGLGGRIRVGDVWGEEGEVPVTPLGELDPLAAEEAELDENLKRQDLTWQEQASAIARLHALRLKQASLIGETHLQKDTATEAFPDVHPDYAQTLVKQDLILANHLSNPDVAKAKTPKDAIKILKRQEATRQNEELAARVGRTFNSSVHKLEHGDCIPWLRGQSENLFDVILTDPPYGMGADSFGDGGGLLANNEHSYNDGKDAWDRLVRDLAPELFRVAKPQAHCYIFCDIDNFHELRTVMRDAGWYVFRTPLINYKPRSGRIPLPENGPRRQYELCLYAIKGWKPVTAIYSDVITTVLEEAMSHGAQKPVELYIDLLRRSIRPGDMVLDPFCGTGTIFPAAHALKCRATGVEMSPEYYGMSVSRLNDLDNEPAML